MSHTRELDEIYGGEPFDDELPDCDYDAINENFEEKVWEDLDLALHNISFLQKLQDLLYKKLIDNYAEAIHFNGVKDILMSAVNDL